MKERPRSNEYRTTIVCVDSYEEGILSGRFYNPFRDEETRFQSWSQFLVGMEQMLDEMRFPQSFTAARSFGPPGYAGGQDQEQGSARSAKSKNGSVGTFSVRILFRQNASWQGSVAWLEGGQEESFRSVLELILLMNSALKGE